MDPLPVIIVAGTVAAYTYQGNTTPANGGRIFHPLLPVEYHFKEATSDALDNIASGSDPRGAIVEGFAEWQRESGFTATLGQDSIQTDAGNDGLNLISFADTPAIRTRFGGAICDRVGTLAVTFLWRNTETNTVIDADILFNPCKQWSTTGVDETFPISSVGTHEIGHFLGLDHSVVGAATMFAFGSAYGSFAGSAESSASISSDDRAGANGLYPEASFADKTRAK